MSRKVKLEDADIMSEPTRFSSEEGFRRGAEIYERDIRPIITPDKLGKIVAIDVATGVYGIGDDRQSAARIPLSRNRDAQLWVCGITDKDLPPVRISTLAAQDEDNELPGTTAEERIDMMWQLAKDAWEFMGESVGERQFQRHVVRIIRSPG